jgi:uncharacterized protein (DUF849 family)
MTNKKVIISCAVTGSVHTPSLSPYLPYKPEDIIQQSIEAVEAGASILHLHARDPNDGRPSPKADDYMAFLPAIKGGCDAVVNITTGGSPVMSMEQRLDGAIRAQPEMASLNMGSMNFGMFPMAANERDWQFDWEKPYLLGSEDMVFKNTFKDIAYILQTLGEGFGTRFECECYDISHLYTLAHFVDRGLIKPPFLVQSIFGILGGIGGDVQNLMFMKETADRLFGDQYQWSILGAGPYQMPLITHGALMGGNVRVGLEDNLWLGKGQLATSNAALVTKARTIIEELGYEIATPAEAREILQLKGVDAVNF